jgi:hypothetical protein
MTKKGTVKLNIMAYSSTTAKLCAALGRNQDEEALRLMKEHSLDPETGASTPRTKAYIATGEWDAKERIGIRLIVDNNYAGWIGTTAASPSGVDRFCGKLKCTIAAHKHSRVAIKSQFWYIQAGPLSPSGLFASPNLPAASLGGPIPKSYEARVSDSSRQQFDGLTLGQWKFLFEFWTSEREPSPQDMLSPELSTSPDVPPFKSTIETVLSNTAALGMKPIFETTPKKESPPVPEVPVHPLAPLSTVFESTPTCLGPDLPIPTVLPLPEDSEMLMRSLVLRIEKLESQHKASNNFIQKMFSQQQVMQAENITLDDGIAVLKKNITQVNSERISILAKLKELSRKSIDSKRTVNEELQSSLLAIQMDRDSLLSQIRATEAEIQALRSCFAALEAHALSVGISTFSDQDRSRLDLFEFEINDSTGAFKKLEQELAGLSNKLESGGGVDFHGFTFFNGLLTEMERFISLQMPWVFLMPSELMWLRPKKLLELKRQLRRLPLNGWDI